MRYRCHFCDKSVTSELPDDSVIRAILVCPECVADEKVLIPEPPLAQLDRQLAEERDSRAKSVR